MMKHSMDKKTETCPTPLELLNLYYSDGQTTGNKTNRLWQKMNSLLSWENIIEHQYQSDLCPLLYFIITKALPKQNRDKLLHTIPKDVIVPDIILSFLREHYQASLLRNMILLKELKCVSTELKNQDIRAVVLKGGYLAENVYDNIACRPMGDLDLFVINENREKSYNIMIDMGYVYSPDSESNETLHYSFTKKVLGHFVKIEIHHRLAKEKFMTKYCIEDISLRGYMHMEELLNHLSWHTIRHGVTRLVWLCDIAQIVRNMNATINWTGAKITSKEFNTDKQFTFVIHLTSTLLLPLFSTGIAMIEYPLLRIYESLFLIIQFKAKHRKDAKAFRLMLSLLLMRTSDIKKLVQSI